VTLKTKDLAKTTYEPGFRDAVLRIISDPNIAYILMMIASLACTLNCLTRGLFSPGSSGPYR